MSRRIILFGPLPPPYGGVAIFMKTVIEHFRDPRIRVWTYGGGAPDDPRVRFIAHRALGIVPSLISEAKGARILDASHFHLEYPNPLLLAAWLLLKPVLGFEWYKNIHDGSLPKRHHAFGKMQHWLFQRAVNGVDQFVVVSEELRRWLQDDIHVRQPIVVVPSLLPPVKGQQVSCANSTGLQPYLAHAKRICSIGVFHPAYGFKHVAEAVEQIREQDRKDLGLLLLDGGFVRDESYRDEVLRGRDWITVLEEVPNPEVTSILKQSDVFVRAFADESYGLSRIEALWAGIPVVATRAGETRGMLLYDFGNTEQLVHQLQTVLFEPRSDESDDWPAHYRKEAQHNLKKLANVLGI